MGRKFKLEDDEAVSMNQVQTQLRYAPVLPVRLNLLKEHPLNKEFFAEETDSYFQRLREDIQKRGVATPLIAKRDGTLLAGHNRLRIAKELGLPTVPVQYVSENEKYKLTADDEREFLIKDNLLRRQFSSEEWIQTYRNLYPDFDEAIAHTSRSTGLNATKIAADTGQTKAAVQKQLQKLRKEHNGSPKVERVHVGTRELRSAIEEALAALGMKNYAEAQEILEGVL